jgi:leucyl-tRNA synthetase
VNEDIQVRFHLNTAIASIMEMVNYYYSLSIETVQEDEKTLLAYLFGLKMMIVLLSPFVPHIAEEIWHKTGFNSYILQEPWPEYNESLIHQDYITLVVQVNGKLRAKMEVQRDLDEEAIKNLALQDEKIIKYTEGKNIIKMIVVQNRLLNIVVK